MLTKNKVWCEDKCRVQKHLNSLRMSLVGNCDRRLLMFISAPTNSSCARSLGAPQWHSTCRPANSLCWHVQPLSNARPDERSPASTCTLPELVLRVSTGLFPRTHTPLQHIFIASIHSHHCNVILRMSRNSTMDKRNLPSKLSAKRVQLKLVIAFQDIRQWPLCLWFGMDAFKLPN